MSPRLRILRTLETSSRDTFELQTETPSSAWFWPTNRLLTPCLTHEDNPGQASVAKRLRACFVVNMYLCPIYNDHLCLLVFRLDDVEHARLRMQVHNFLRPAGMNNSRWKQLLATRALLSEVIAK